MIQAIHPEIVGPTDALEDVPVAFGFEPAYRGWITDDRTRAGHMGKPRYASPEKGEHLLNAYANGISDFLLKVADWDGHSWLPHQSE